MALEQWEINLRKQLENVQSVKKEIKAIQEIKAINLTNDFTFYISMFVFLILSFIFFLDIKTDIFRFISIKENNNNQIYLDQSQSKPPEPYSSDELEKIKERIKRQEEKTFLLGLITNENTFILKQGKSKKEMLNLNKNWTLNQRPIYLELTNKDIEYLESLNN